MTDGPTGRPADGPGRPLSPDEELAVTRALRDLPAPPVPPALAARLDARLAELAAERPSGEPALAPARPGPTAGAGHRHWPRLLIAAAAVLVGGYAVGSAVHGTLGGGAGGTSSASAGSSADRSAGTPAAGRAMGAGPGVRSSPVALHAGSLAADVRRVLDGRSQAPARTLVDRCPAPAVPGTAWLVRYDGRRAVLVTRPVAGGRVRATVYACGGTRPEATTAVRSR